MFDRVRNSPMKGTFRADVRKDLSKTDNGLKARIANAIKLVLLNYLMSK